MGRPVTRALFVALAMTLVVASATSCSTGERQVRTSGSNADDASELHENVDDDGQVHLGANAQVDLAIFFKPTLSDGEIASFIDEVLNRPLEGARFGKDLLPGMQSTLADYERRAVYVGFFDNASDVQRQAVKNSVLASPLVDRIEEGIVPAEKYPDPPQTTTTAAG
jgi:hypothetical protein